MPCLKLLNTNKFDAFNKLEVTYQDMKDELKMLKYKEGIIKNTKGDFIIYYPETKETFTFRIIIENVYPTIITTCNDYDQDMKTFNSKYNTDGCYYKNNKCNRNREKNDENKEPPYFPPDNDYFQVKIIELKEELD